VKRPHHPDLERLEPAALVQRSCRARHQHVEVAELGARRTPPVDQSFQQRAADSAAPELRRHIDDADVERRPRGERTAERDQIGAGPSNRSAVDSLGDQEPPGAGGDAAEDRRRGVAPGAEGSRDAGADDGATIVDLVRRMVVDMATYGGHAPARKVGAAISLPLMTARTADRLSARS
jgi:hypothetical protein